MESMPNLLILKIKKKNRKSPSLTSYCRHMPHSLHFCHSFITFFSSYTKLCDASIKFSSDIFSAICLITWWELPLFCGWYLGIPSSVSGASLAWGSSIILLQQKYMEMKVEPIRSTTRKTPKGDFIRLSKSGRGGGDGEIWESMYFLWQYMVVIINKILKILKF